LVRVAVLRHDRIRGELDDGEGQLLALDAARDDALPDPDRGDLGERDEVRHRDLRSGRPHGRRSVEPTRDRLGGSATRGTNGGAEVGRGPGWRAAVPGG